MLTQVTAILAPMRSEPSDAAGKFVGGIFFVTCALVLLGAGFLMVKSRKAFLRGSQLPLSPVVSVIAGACVLLAGAGALAIGVHVLTELDR